MEREVKLLRPRPELAAGTEVKIRKVGWRVIVGLESWRTKGGSRIYQVRTYDPTSEVRTVSEADIWSYIVPDQEAK